MCVCDRQTQTQTQTRVGAVTAGARLKAAVMGALHSQDSRPDGPPDRRAAGRVGGDQARRERGGKGEERTEGEKKGEVGGGEGGFGGP